MSNRCTLRPQRSFSSEDPEPSYVYVSQLDVRIPSSRKALRWRLLFVCFYRDGSELLTAPVHSGCSQSSGPRGGRMLPPSRAEGRVDAPSRRPVSGRRKCPLHVGGSQVGCMLLAPGTLFASLPLARVSLQPEKMLGPQHLMHLGGTHLVHSGTCPILRAWPVVTCAKALV